MTDRPQARNWSLRRHLTRGVISTVAVAWLLTILIALWSIDRELREALDAELAMVAETTLLTLETADGPVVPRLVGVSTDDSERVLRISGLGGGGSVAPWGVVAGDGLADSQGWRVIRLTGDHAVVEAAQRLRWRREETAEAAAALLVLVLPMTALLLWGIRRTIRRGLASAERFAQTVGQRRPDDLSPVAAVDLPEELTPLAQALNGYLARIDRLRQGERRFVAHAAHELRTPLAAIRARLQVAGGGQDQAVTMVDALTCRLDRLLQLSRSDSGLGAERGPSDLVQVLRLVIDELARPGVRAIQLDDGDMDRAPVAIDPDAAAILLRNLIENALDHGHGLVRVALAPGPQVRVSNPTTRPAFLEEPFAKDGASGGMGLGLAIVAGLAEAMEAPVDKQIRDGQACVTVDFSARAI